MDSLINSKASEDFNRARNKARFMRIFDIIKSEKKELLSYYDVKNMTKPKGESYLGMKVVNIKDIIGSEGRYTDFIKAFLPKKEHLRKRWENIDRAHLKDIILPPISLFKIGDVYFVRDGNHRVSVANAKGVHSIDAEVVELTSEIRITSQMTKMDIKRAVLLYEREKVMEFAQSHRMLHLDNITFTSLGRYDEMLRHIHGHKYFLNLGIEREITMRDATTSWYENVYMPISHIIEKEHMLNRFPGRTIGDIYIWTIKHWDGLKWKYGQEYPLDEAVKEYSQMYGKNLWQKIREIFKKKSD